MPDVIRDDDAWRLDVRVAVKAQIQARVASKLHDRSLLSPLDEAFAKEPLHCHILHTACDILTSCLHASSMDTMPVRMQLEIAHRLLSKELERVPSQDEARVAKARLRPRRLRSTA
ncbi:hypothetical protein SPRG_14768 [Saprolegnia parasitica CBS 223.65]|uniref:Uncharacterized protein n=1 Tax=Saprolegnia parasitica (strain CBS 223.65) TaxID=695850 RepID=A0A067BN99_SAPPC|nr:hypothetical protein SPRG_14768 [Saprolegnia parasitica CBS 223.65]KDO19688.1 hypothetical protein SPRG_14768 [Saprolegnia parasitica CBS 223.65]|eukprot:XP_012209605.1 hypothetical protein SPRG_14768 [Saprolegnia parasitica CBS 223.65]